MAEQNGTEAAPDAFTLIPHVWIPMSDGCRLAARLWLPQGSDAEPVPAILEYIPYRKGDLMAMVDSHIGPWFAEHGYAYVRVDLRGAGDSEGIIYDEYLPQEQDDGVEVIRWMAEQPWCTGSVGMIGFSWGGFNGLQVAARRPPELKAVISMYSTDDRYADDVHYLGGCLNSVVQLPWASEMLAHMALPPDPVTVGESWRDMWFDRLEQTPPNIDPWMEHQRRDAYWKHGSVCEDYGDIECPVYMVGGWEDGYTNAVLRFVEGHEGVRKGVIGPWSHWWPQDVRPGPTIGFLQECLRWWDRWLKGEKNGIDREPRVRAFMQEPWTPQTVNEPRRGRWVAEDDWPSARIEARTYQLGDGVLGGGSDEEIALEHHPVYRHGSLAGAWCPYGAPTDFPPDQREEDAVCLTFTSEPLPERLELLGRPRLRVAFAVDKPLALLAARLCDVAPDGTSTLMTRSALNLTHLDGHEEPKALVPGDRYVAEFELNVVGQAVEPGHRLRLSLSTTYWPWLWPSPEPVVLTVFTGEGSSLELPIRPPSAADADLRPFEPAEQAPGLRREVLESAPGYEEIQRDPWAGTIVLDSGGRTRYRFVDSGIEYSHGFRPRFSIREGDPLTAEVLVEVHYGLGRGSWQVRVETTSTMSSDAHAFHLQDRLEAYEGHRRVFARSWSRSVPRDHL
jgi:hypothetical protein